MISEVRPKCFTVQSRSLPVIFSLLRIGQLVGCSWSARYSINLAQWYIQNFQRGEKNIFWKRNTFATEFFTFFTENRGFHTIFRQNTKLCSRLLIYCQINRSNGFFGIAFASFWKFWIRLFKNGDFNWHLGPKFNNNFFWFYLGIFFSDLRPKGWGAEGMAPCPLRGPLIRKKKCVKGCNLLEQIKFCFNCFNCLALVQVAFLNSWIRYFANFIFTLQNRTSNTSKLKSKNGKFNRKHSFLLLSAFCAASWRNVGRNNYYNSNFLFKKPFSLLNIVSDIAMGLDVGWFSSPKPYPCTPAGPTALTVYACICDFNFCIHKIIQNLLLCFDLSTLWAVNLEL